MDGSSALGWVDITALGVLAVFLLWGLLRGVVQQLLWLVLIAGGLALSALLSPRFGLWIREKVWAQLTDRVANAIAFVLVFVAVLVLGGLLLKVLRESFGKTRTPVWDRILGGLLGVVKGALLLMVLILAVVNLLGGEEDSPGFVQDVRSSEAAHATRWTAARVGALLPEGPRATLDRYVEALPPR